MPGYWERTELPLDLARRLAELGLVGDGIEGYGCPQMTLVAAGLVQMELSRGDGASHTFEGTEGIQTLIVGRDITGVSAFA